MSSSSSEKTSSCYDAGKKSGSETPSISNSLNNAPVAVVCGIIQQGGQYEKGYQDGKAERESKNQ
jgi:hypothetical protein